MDNELVSRETARN